MLPVGSLAQLVEQRTFNPLVAGSSPARPTTNLQYQRKKALRVIVTPFLLAGPQRATSPQSAPDGCIHQALPSQILINEAAARDTAKRTSQALERLSGVNVLDMEHHLPGEPVRPIRRTSKRIPCGRAAAVPRLRFR